MSDDERMDMGGDEGDYEGYDPDEIKCGTFIASSGMSLMAQLRGRDGGRERRGRGRERRD
jgi:hypothetical protein